jgi:hypothetical protein
MHGATIKIKKKNLLNKKWVFLFLSAIFWNITHSNESLGTYDKKMYIGLHIKYPLFLSDFNETLNIFDRFSKDIPVLNFIKIHLVGAELFHADRSRGGQTDVTKPIAAFFFRNFANVPKTSKFWRTWCLRIPHYCHKLFPCRDFTSFSTVPCEEQTESVFTKLISVFKCVRPTDSVCLCLQTHKTHNYINILIW